MRAQAQSALKHADLAFNDPETMILNEPELLVLALEPRLGEDVATALTGKADRRRSESAAAS